MYLIYIYTIYDVFGLTLVVSDHVVHQEQYSEIYQHYYQGYNHAIYCKRKGGHDTTYYSTKL